MDAVKNPPTIIPRLTAILANTYALAVKTHAAHWNVSGPAFFGLHAAFAEQYHGLIKAADELAERLRALGEPSPGGLIALCEVSTIRDAVACDSSTICRSLAEDHQRMSEICQEAGIAATDDDDECTGDLLFLRSAQHAKLAWMLAACDS